MSLLMTEAKTLLMKYVKGTHDAIITLSTFLLQKTKAPTLREMQL